MSARRAALAAAAAAWQDPDHAPRQQAARAAVERGLTTEAAAAFACNQFAHACTDEALAGLGLPGEPFLPAVAVRQPTDVPLLGARAFAAAVLSAERVSIDGAEPVLVAFAEDVAERVGGDLLQARAAEPPAAVLEAGGEAHATAGDPAVPVWYAAAAPAEAVVDGEETDEEWIGLAEDLLLHDGKSPRSVRIVWAPEDLSPDDLLDAMAGFRELFPAAASLDGSLQMPKAFLKAAGTPHAWAPGFLLSKGDPDAQSPGHVRWATYDDVAALSDRGPGRYPVVASERIATRLGGACIAPGDAHRPPLEGHLAAASAAAFLSRLRAA